MIKPLYTLVINNHLVWFDNFPTCVIRIKFMQNLRALYILVITRLLIITRLLEDNTSL